MWRRCAPPRIKAVQCYTTHTMWHRASARMWPRVMRWNDIAPTLQRCAPLPLEQLEALKTDTMGLMATNTCRTSIWPRPINQGQDFIDLGIVQIAELFTLRCDQTLSVSVSPKSYHNIRWITAVQGHVRNFFIFWLGSFLCGKGLEDKHCDADLVRVNEYFWVFLPVFSCLFFRQAL